ncbi:unnamed protein product, partial [Rotaria sp. Silwood1]
VQIVNAIKCTNDSVSSVGGGINSSSDDDFQIKSKIHVFL